MTQYKLADGRVIEQTYEGPTTHEWGGGSLAKPTPVWRLLGPNGTSQTVNINLVRQNGKNYFTVNDEPDFVEIVAIT